LQNPYLTSELLLSALEGAGDYAASGPITLAEMQAFAASLWTAPAAKAAAPRHKVLVYGNADEGDAVSLCRTFTDAVDCSSASPGGAAIPVVASVTADPEPRALLLDVGTDRVLTYRHPNAGEQNAAVDTIYQVRRDMQLQAQL
jgi:hypothetical protein